MAGDFLGLPTTKMKIRLKKANFNDLRMVKSMAPAPIKEEGTDEEDAPTERSAGVKKILDGRM